MKTGNRTRYHGVLDIPEGTAGDFAVRHVIKAPGEEVLTSTIRTAMFRGQSQKNLTFKHETRWHSLLEDGHVWMTDYPVEQIQHDIELRGFSGRVLVGGLGLGYAATALAAKARVTHIDVVEISAEVIALVAPHVAHAKVNVIHADLFDYLKRDDLPAYRHGFYDIWASDGEHTFHTLVNPLRELSHGKVFNVACWNEQVMRGQLYMGLESRVRFALDPAWAGMPHMNVEELATPSGNIYGDWAAPFWQWVQATSPSITRAIEAARTYVRYYGIAPSTDVLTSIL